MVIFSQTMIIFNKYRQYQLIIEGDVQDTSKDKKTLYGELPDNKKVSVIFTKDNGIQINIDEDTIYIE